MKILMTSLCVLFFSLAALGAGPSLEADCEISTNKGHHKKEQLVFNKSRGYVFAFSIDRSPVFISLSKVSNKLAFWIGREGADGIDMGKIDGMLYSDIVPGTNEEFNIKWRLGLIKLKMSCLFLSKE